MTVTADQECDTTEDIEKPPDDGEDASDAGEKGPKTAARQRKRYAGVAVVAAVYLGAFGLAGGLGWKLWDEHTVTQAGQAAQRTAIDYAQVLTSIDSNQVDQNFSAVLDGATGEFKDTYTKASVQLRQLLVDNKATAHGTVVDSAIESLSKTRVVVLLMVDQTVSNAVRPDGRVDRSRMKITMDNVGGHWLASKVELP
ncbi:Mce protein [Mycobacterium intracellulare]|uniref:Mce protein n=1 Tax=Mycobacterium intracellulare TaxID=1767 RepID=UPI000B8CA72B|nr:Mce protein [Mycobacterium intracellulare]ASQ84333.1 Mce protein [Mycobacterium intracellulare subsp. chimaera]MCF1813905.1 Mce protein [Mycobacterium intracellulare subsp. intracellulare]MDS0335692.1 Mce protein [Mycobacterium intracellulare]